MPNWCENELYVSGRKDDLKRFKEMAKGKNGDLDFNSFIPYPEEWQKLDEAYWGSMKKLNELNQKLKKAESEDEKQKIRKTIAEVKRNMPEKDGYNNGGYEWCCKNWGTKWNACNVELTEEKRSLIYAFDTAWSPPCPVVLKMSEMFPNLLFTLKYWECGVGFKGVFKAKGGVITKDKCVEYFGDRGG